MGEIITAGIVFVCLSAASIGMMYLYPRLSARHRDDETNTVLRLVANIFVVMTSLVFGLLINSSKNTFETIDSNVHGFSTSLIMFDRSLRTYGVEPRRPEGGSGSTSRPPSSIPRAATMPSSTTTTRRPMHWTRSVARWIVSRQRIVSTKGCWPMRDSSTRPSCCNDGASSNSPKPACRA